MRFRWPTGLAVLAALVAVFGIMSTGASSSRVATATITPSPAWTDAQLSAPAGDNWLEYYGSLTGDRYSSLNQITTSNVSTLKEVWHMSLGTCTAGLIAGNPVIPGAPKGATNNPTNCGSMESNPVAVDGVLYTTNAPLGAGLRDRRGDRRTDLELDAVVRRRDPEQRVASSRPAAAAAAQASRSARAWSSTAFRTAASSRSTRSPASRCGRPPSARTRTTRRSRAPRSTSTAWSSPVTARATAAATARRSRPSGPRTARASGAGARSRRPVSPATSTWTNNGKGGNGSTLYGGGSFWESPLVDTARHLIVVGTGNPEPWNSRGPGENLYTDSIVGLDLYTGQMKWYFQQVHHDMWDSDLPNNGVMFDGKFKVTTKVKVKGKVKTRTKPSPVPPSPTSTRSA